MRHDDVRDVSITQLQMSALALIGKINQRSCFWNCRKPKVCLQQRNVIPLYTCLMDLALLIFYASNRLASIDNFALCTNEMHMRFS